MTARRLIYLSSHQVSAFRWKSGVLTDEGSFDASDGGLRAFSGYLAENAKSIFVMLANVSEEGFHIETIPFLRGEDRRSIIARKLGQLFFNARLTTSLSLGHQKSRRRDERILLAALTNHETFSPWLGAMARREVALAGIYSLPLLGPALLKKLGVPQEPCLLLTIQDQSIRQSYLENGELHFSRLTPLQNTSIGGIAQTFSTEASKLQQYLVSQRLIGRKQAVTAYLLAHANARKAIETSCVDSETLSFITLDIADSASKCHLKVLPASSQCEPIFLNLLATDPPRAQFANDDQRHDYHLWFVRAVLRGVGVVVMLSCLLLSGKQAVDSYQLNQEIDVLAQETALASQRYADIVKTFPPIPTSNETLRRVINRYTELEKGSTSPASLYREISRALDSTATVELEGIEWKVGAGQSPQASLNPGALPNDPPPGDTETAIVRGTLRLGAESNPRQVLAVFNRLVDALKLNDRLEVEVLQQPFDVESGKSLKGGGATVEDEQPRTFKVRVSRTIGS